jgi:hopanoid biosynthesis associated RND transporter like protein HpnN
LAWLALIAHQHPRKTLSLCGLLLAISVALGYRSLELRMDWTYLFYPDDQIVVSGQAFRESFPLPGDVAVLVDRGTPEQRRAYLDRLAQRMKAEPMIFHHVLHRFDLTPLAPKALYFLDEAQLRSLLAALAVIKGGQATGASEETGRMVLLKLLDDLRIALETRGRATYVPIWETLASGQNEDTVNYLRLLLEGERYVYPTVGSDISLVAAKAGTRGQEFVNASPMIIRLREIIDELSPTAGTLRIRLTGLPVLLHDERETVSRDGARSTGVSLVLIALVFAVGFGEIKRPLLAVVALLFGMAWTVGFTTVAIGYLNFISVTLATMLMGVGIDFGIHFIFRYDEEMGKGLSSAEAIVATLRGTGVDTFVGAVATSAAFLALTQANFRGISDFGIIAAGGTMLCFLSTIVVLPALLSLFPGRARGVAGTSAEVVWLETTMLRHSRAVVFGWLLLVVVACMLATNVGFNYNLLEIQAQNVSTVRTEIEMVQEHNTVLSAEVMAKDISEARCQHQALSSLPAVANVGSLLPLLPETSPTKQALIERIVSGLKTVQLPEQVRLSTAGDLSALSRKADELQSSLPQSQLDPELESAVTRVKEDLETMDPGPIQDSLAAFQANVREDLSGTLAFLKLQKAEPPGLDEVPAELKLRYLSADGSMRQTVQPVKDIWQRENLEEFLSQVQAVEPGVMGHPVIQEAILSAFSRTLDRTPWFTLLGVLVVFSLYLRNLRAVVLSLLPACLAVLMIFAVLGWAHMDFNVLSFVGLPISVGLGAVYGVHSLHRMRELNDERVLTTSTGPALVLSGVTDIVGFASLMVAQHRGISSLGLVISIGIGVSFTASLILLPTLRRFTRELAERKSTPVNENPDSPPGGRDG